MAFDLGSFLQRELAKQNHAPSKRVVKARSGRSARRTHSGQMWLNSVGGYASDVKAIYQPEGTEMCVVVDPRKGYKEDGTLRREPRW